MAATGCRIPVRGTADQYCLDALQTISTMSTTDVRKLALDLAMGGRVRLEVNNPSSRFRDFRGFRARNPQPDPLAWHGQMSLSETTRKVLVLVEERSGIPVHVEPDPNLPGTLLAKVVMARDNLPLHCDPA